MKSFFKTTLSVLIIFLFSISFFSCKKVVEDKIEGQWKMINLEDPSVTKEEWHFAGHNIYFLNGQTKDTLGSCSYVVKTSPFRKKVLVSNMDYPQTQYQILTEFVIRKLNSKCLILINDEQGGILTLEFTK